MTFNDGISAAPAPLTPLLRSFLSRLNPYDFPRLVLEAAGIRQSDLVKRYGLHKGELSECLRGKNNCGRIRLLIAAELGVSADDLWPKKS